ncbi:MAG: S-methyl-5'-thioadenosine phosphorylase [Candidatus Omnitrophica bacterium]|nr:S-methyl-5'-thioadenosine phosphorylase [Candidatus Omnitrophota bacterium]
MMGRIGVIGGSGLYHIDELEIIAKKDVTTPYGGPSDRLTIGRYKGREIVFLPRHGAGHTILPGELNFRANIYAMKKLGVEWLISLSACGSFREELKPRDIVIVDQFFDRTNQARKTTFFGDGIVAHISFSHPVCPSLSEILYKTALGAGMPVHRGGTYVNMEGPAFSTKAESCVYKSWGMDVIGMTNMAEARLAREAEICYSTVAFVTDYDAWHESKVPVTLEMIIENLNKNVENARALLKLVVPAIPEKRTCECREALRYAILTKPDAVPAKTKKKLKLIIGKYVQ